MSEEEETERQEIKDETHELEDEKQEALEEQSEDADASTLQSHNEQERESAIENEQPEQEIQLGQEEGFETGVLKEKKEERIVDTDKLPVEEQLAEVRQDNELLQKQDEQKQYPIRGKRE